MTVSSTNSGSVEEILTSEQVDAIRKGYDRELMNRAAAHAIVSPYPRAQAFADFLTTHFYDSDRWPGDRREQCLITYFTSHSAGNAFNLGVHLYWGLMEGLDVPTIADTILLTSAYAGIDNYSNAIGVLKKVLTLLSSLVTSEDPEKAVACANVVGKIRALL